MTDAAENPLGREPVGRLFVRLALPAVTAQVINVLYNLVDRMYIGHIPDIGGTALTGVGVTSPVLLLLIPLIFLLPRFVPDPAMGVLLAEPVSDTLAVCTTSTVFFFRFRKQMREIS